MPSPRKIHVFHAICSAENQDHTTPFTNMYHRHAKSVNISTNAFFALEKLSPENVKKGPKVEKKPKEVHELLYVSYDIYVIL